MIKVQGKRGRDLQPGLETAIDSLVVKVARLIQHRDHHGRCRWWRWLRRLHLHLRLEMKGIVNVHLRPSRRRRRRRFVTCRRHSCRSRSNSCSRRRRHDVDAVVVVVVLSPRRAVICRLLRHVCCLVPRGRWLA